MILPLSRLHHYDKENQVNTIGNHSMKTLLRWTVPHTLVCLVITLFVSVATAQAQEQHPLLGKPAPGFSLPSVDGEMIRLNQLKGQVVVLDFWATWCPPCRAAMPELQKLHERYAEQGVKIIGVNLREDRATAKRFIEQNGLDFDFVLDEQGRAGRIYRVTGIPQTVFIDREGIVQSVHVGFSQGTEIQYARELDALIAGESLIKAPVVEPSGATTARIDILKTVGKGNVITDKPLQPGEGMWINAPMPGTWFEHPNVGKMLAVVGDQNNIVLIGQNPEGETEARPLPLELPDEAELMDFSITTPDQGIALATVSGEFDLDGTVLRMQLHAFNNAAQPVWSADIEPAGKSVPDFTVRFGKLTADGLHLIFLADYDYAHEAGLIARQNPELDALLAQAEGTRLLVIYDFKTGEVVYRDWIPGDTHGAGFHVLPGYDGAADRVLIANDDGLVPLTLVP